MNLISFLTPTNLSQEKERFFNSNTYHPQFQYNWRKNQLQSWLKTHPEYIEFSKAFLNQNNQQIKIIGEQTFSTQLNSEILLITKSITQNTPKKLPTPSMK